MKRAVIIILILVAAVGGGWAGYQYLQPPAPAAVTDDPTVEIAEATLDTLVEQVSATGQIEPRAEVEMKFEIGGVVEAVLVERGQYVTAGTVLAKLRTDKLELDLESAEIDLAQREAELEKLFEPQLAEDITSAQADLHSARLKLAELVDGPDAEEITKAEAELALKQVELKKAQWDYDQVAYRGDVGAMPQADALQEATLNYEIALATYNQATKEATEAEIAEARATVASRQAALAQLLQDPSPADLAAKQSAVDQAKLTLREKRNNLKEAVLVAPTDGVVLDVAVEPGERVLTEADNPAMLIANTSAYLLKVQVDEIDIGRIRPGQPSRISLDAFRDVDFSGQVTEIAPRPTQTDAGGGIVTFEVTVTLDADEASPQLLPGMTATADIETDRLNDVVVIPNRAIQFERLPEQTTVFVEKLDDAGNLSRVEVELGLRNGGVTEIKAGLAPGEQVVIRTEPESGQPASL